MRKLLASLFVLIVAVLAAVVIVPEFVDWNEYKGDIAREVKKATGRDIFIGGDLKISFLPAPTLSVEDLRLTNAEGASEPDMVSLEALYVRVALRPLFKGEIEVESISLVSPVVHLEVFADGRNNWTFAAPVAPGEGGEPEGGEEEAGGPELMVTLNQVTIEDGRLSYRAEGSGTFEEIVGLNAEIVAESLEGPFFAEGEFMSRGLPLSFAARIGSIAAGRDVPLSLDLRIVSADARMQFAGSLAGPLSDRRFVGDLHVAGSDFAKLVSVASHAAAPESAPPAVPGFLAERFALDGGISASPGGIDLNDLALQFSDIRATGAVSALFGPPLKADAALSLARIDLDQLLAREREARGTEGKAGAPKASPGAPSSAGKTGGEGFSLPAGITGSLDVSAEVVVYNGKVIREAVVDVALEEGRLVLRNLSALLPGSTRFALSGAVTAKDGAANFSGTLETVSDNLRGVLEWLKIDASRVPAERLRRFSLSGEISGTSQQLNITGLNVFLDATRIKGGVAIALRKRPSFGVRLDLDNLNVDAYLPEKAAAEKPAGREKAALPAPLAKAEKSPLLSPLAFLDTFDANLKANIGRLTVNKVPVEGVSLDGTLQGGKLTLRDVGIQSLAGAGIKISGTVEKLGGSPEVNIGFDLRTRNLPKLFRLGGSEPPPFAGRMGRVAVSGRIMGGIEDLRIDSGLDIAAGKVTLSGALDVLSGPPKLDITVDATHPDLGKLVRVFLPQYRPAAVNLGGLSLRGKLRMEGDRISLTGLESRIGPVALSGEAEIRLGGARPYVKATLSGSEIVTDLFLPVPKKSLGLAPAHPRIVPAAQARENAGATPRWSREPIDLTGLAGFDADVKLAAAALSYDKYRVVDPKLVLNLKDGVLNVNRFTGTMFEGAFDLKGRLVASARPTLSGSVSVANANVRQALFTAGDIDFADGRLDFNLEAATGGMSPFEMVSKLSGKGAMNVADGVVKGFDISAVSERLKNLDNAVGFLNLLQSSMSGGSTRFTKFAGTFTIDEGVVRSDDIRLLAKAGEGKAAGIVDLPRWMLDIEAKFFLTEHPKAPPFGMRLTGSIDKPRRIFDIEQMQAFLLQRGIGTLLRKVMPKKEEPAPAPGAGEPAPKPEKPLDILLEKIMPKELAPAPAAAEPAPAPAVAEPAPAQPAPEQIQPAPEPKKPQKPEDVLKGILKGLFK